jgi:putative transposase
MDTFFEDSDYRQFKALLQDSCSAYGVKVVAYCLMPNHVHLIAIPNRESSLAKAIGLALESYAKYINFKKGWQGYLWQGRFYSSAMDEEHFLRCVPYVELNPVRGALCAHPSQYLWSSFLGHLGEVEDPLLSKDLLLDQIDDWAKYVGVSSNDYEQLRSHTKTGRPLGSESFLKHAEKLSGIPLSKKNPGRPKSGSVVRP